MKKVLLFVLLLALSLPTWAAQKIRMATLSYGTVNWELDTIQHYGFDQQAGLEMELVVMANLPATRLALLNGGADVAVADWMWVSTQRAEGRNYSFIPYSSSVGGLMVRPDAGIQTIKDLEGKKVGIAGGALSKGWLLLQAVAPQYGVDLSTVQTSYAAPPLLNKELLNGRLDAVITYWHLAAALEAEGMQRLVELADLQQDLGLQSNLPMIGYVFMEDWGKANPLAVAGLAKASADAKLRLAQDDQAWERLRSKMNTNSEAHFQELKKGYLRGIPRAVTESQRTDAAKLFAKLGEYGGKELTGPSDQLMEGTFWRFD